MNKRIKSAADVVGEKCEKLASLILGEPVGILGTDQSKRVILPDGEYLHPSIKDAQKLFFMLELHKELLQDAKQSPS